jgi:hypothetical protein
LRAEAALEGVTMHGNLVSNSTDLTDLGFTGGDIRMMYLAREPHMLEILEVAALLSNKDRQLALALLHTFATFAALSEARRATAKAAA